MEEFLTEEEKNLLEDIADCYDQFVANVVGWNATRENDLEEIAFHIHALQNAVLAQAAARNYPGKYRLLGDTLKRYKE